MNTGAHPPRPPWPAGDAGLATAAGPVRAAAADELDKRDGAKQLSLEVPRTGQVEDSAIDLWEMTHEATRAPVLRERVGKRR